MVAAWSSTEAEFRAMAPGVCELLWLKTVITDLKVKVQDPIGLYYDNIAAMSIAHNPIHHDRTKHVEINKHFIEEKLDSGLICTPYISTTKQPVDLSTKELIGTISHKFLEKLRRQNIFASAWEGVLKYTTAIILGFHCN